MVNHALKMKIAHSELKLYLMTQKITNVSLEDIQFIGMADMIMTEMPIFTKVNGIKDHMLLEENATIVTKFKEIKSLLLLDTKF